MITDSKYGAPVLISGAYILNTIITYVSLTGVYGCTNSEVSDDNYTLISPPGWAFAIWGVIFTWEGIGCLYASLPCFTSTSRLIVDAKWIWAWVLTCVFQCVWSVVICQSVYVASAFLFLVFFALWFQQQYALRKLSFFRRDDSSQKANNNISVSKRFMLYMLLIAPFSLHLGWVLAASTLNVNIAVVHDGLNSPTTALSVALGSLVYIAAMAWSVGVIGTPMSRSSVDGAFVGGAAWALGAISKYEPRDIKTTEGNFRFAVSVTDSIKNAAAFASAMLALGFVVSFIIRCVVRKFGQTSSDDDNDHRSNSSPAMIALPIAESNVVMVGKNNGTPKVA